MVLIGLNAGVELFLRRMKRDKPTEKGERTPKLLFGHRTIVFGVTIYIHLRLDDTTEYSVLHS